MVGSRFSTAKATTATATAILALTVAGTLAGTSCVHDFAGAKILLTISSAASATPKGQHLELWARDGAPTGGVVIRLNPTETVNAGGGTTATQQAGYALVPAVDFDDPCVIDTDTSHTREAGHLLWKPEGVHECFGHPCADDAERARAAQSIQMRMHQLTDQSPTPLLMFVAWDDFVAGKLRDDAVAAPEGQARLAACTAYWQQSAFAYSGDPRQLTSPVHGTLLGAVDYTSQKPSQIAGGIQINTSFGLKDLRELWLTITPAPAKSLDPDQLDCVASPTTCRGLTYLQGDATVLARGTLHVEMTSPLAGGPTGAATVYNTLEQDPVQF